MHPHHGSIATTTIASLCVVMSCLLPSTALAVTGKAYLDNATDHSGIKVHFLPAFSTDREDSTYTDANGHYQIDLPLGLYRVEFTRKGYQSRWYSDGAQIPIQSVTQLDPVMLRAVISRTISGEVFGTLYADTVYVVIGDLVIPPSQHLIIQPGTRVEFLGDYKVDVLGPIYAIGRPGDSITFTSGRQSNAIGDWYGFEIAAAGTQFEYCVFEYCYSALNSREHGLSVINCHFNRMARGVYVTAPSSVIRGNLFENYEGAGVASCAVWAQGSPYNQAIIECNIIRDGFAHGIMSKSRDIISNNIIIRVKGARGCAIWLHLDAAPKVYNNFISYCDGGIELDESSSKPAQRLIYNNTICYGTEFGIKLNGYGGGARISNNIVWYNKFGFFVTRQVVPDTISFNLVYNNHQGNFHNAPWIGPPYDALGRMVTLNANGDSADVFMNIMLDPRFANKKPPHLSPESPCHGAGAPFPSPHIGFDPSLVCDPPVSVSSTTAPSAPSYITASVAPNPASDRCTIMLNLARSSHITVTLVALDGSSLERTSVGTLPAGAHTVALDLAQVTTGRYWVVVDAQSGLGRGLTESPLRRVLSLSVAR